MGNVIKAKAETGEKWNIKEMEVKLVSWPYLISPEKQGINEDFRRKQRYIVFHAHAQFD